YAYETSRAIPAYNEDGSDYFYTTKEGLKNTAKDYYSPDIKFNIFHELDHSGYESTTSNTSMNFHLDWKLFSMFNWHTQFNLTTTHTNEQEWVDEQSTFAQSKRLLAYGVKEPDAKLASNYYTDTELPMGGILNEKDYRGQSYQLTSSLSYFQTFQKHEVNAIAGIEINSRKWTAKRKQITGISGNGDINSPRSFWKIQQVQEHRGRKLSGDHGHQRQQSLLLRGLHLHVRQQVQFQFQYPG
ncbi:MAG: hypothetical protein ACLU4N_15640, partial [Butyricimonas faecihominis]